jgi:hypothetical protein
MAYEWTQIGYWKTPNLSWTIYLIFAVVFGFIGLDHLYMRSPLTALLKCITNFMTFGFWYFYDIVTALTEEDLVKEYGTGTPFVNTGGIGAGMFSDKPDPEHPPWKFMGYTLASGFPFGVIGLNNFIAGDKWGGFLKFWMTSLFAFPIILLAPFTWMLAIGLTLYGLYVILFNTESLFSQGIPSLTKRFMTNMGPKEIKQVESSGFFEETVRRIFAILEMIPIIGPIVKQTREQVELAATTAMATAKVVKASTVDVAIAGAQAAKTLAVDTPMQAMKAVNDIKDGIQGKIDALPKPADMLVSKIPVVPSPADMLAPKIPPIMKGGGSGASTMQGTVLMTIIYGGLVLAVGNFIYKQYKSKKEDAKVLETYKTLNRKTGSVEDSKYDDIPPSA